MLGCGGISFSSASVAGTAGHAADVAVEPRPPLSPSPSRVADAADAFMLPQRPHMLAFVDSIVRARLARVLRPAPDAPADALAAFPARFPALAREAGEYILGVGAELPVTWPMASRFEADFAAACRADALRAVGAIVAAGPPAPAHAAALEAAAQAAELWEQPVRARLDAAAAAGGPPPPTIENVFALQYGAGAAQFRAVLARIRVSGAASSKSFFFSLS
jgi:hypothetical protein